jgi:TonB family protein
MPSRILLPNRSADVRWGYLDKFERNPFLARSFVATSFAAAAAVLLLRSWEMPRSAPPVPQRITIPVDLIETSFVARPIVPVHTKSAVHVRPEGRVVPSKNFDVDVPVEPRTGPASGSSSSGTGVPHPADEEFISIPRAPDPDADAFIPVEQDPVLVTMPRPSYPDLAREARIEGIVLVRVLVGEDGFVRQCVVVQSVLGLDEVAVAAARAAVFRPALQQQRPVAVWAVVPIEFRLLD